jgi:hypothetical protein
MNGTRLENTLGAVALVAAILACPVRAASSQSDVVATQLRGIAKVDVSVVPSGLLNGDHTLEDSIRERAKQILSTRGIEVVRGAEPLLSVVVDASRVDARLRKNEVLLQMRVELIETVRLGRNPDLAITTGAVTWARTRASVETASTLRPIVNGEIDRDMKVFAENVRLANLFGQPTTGEIQGAGTPSAGEAYEACGFSAYKPIAEGSSTPPSAVLKRGPAPSYPQAAVEKRTEGTVVVRVLVDGHGKSVKACAVSGPAELRAAAAASAEKYLWRPALLNGKPVPFMVRTLTFKFQLG